MNNDFIANYWHNCMRKRLFCIILNCQFVKLVVKTNNNLRKIFKFLKTDNYLFFSSLVDLFSVDKRAKKVSRYRFELQYYFFSTLHAFSRLTILTAANRANEFFSVASIFKAAMWLEREIWDLYGVFFYFNNDLRKLITDYGFQGFPMRWDFPVTGYNEIRYNEEENVIVADKISFTQNFKFFLNQNNVWSIF